MVLRTLSLSDLDQLCLKANKHFHESLVESAVKYRLRGARPIVLLAYIETFRFFHPGQEAAQAFPAGGGMGIETPAASA